MAGNRIDPGFVAPQNIPIGSYVPDNGSPGTPQYMLPSGGNTQYLIYPAAGWAPKLREFPGGTPDPGRNKDEPLYEYRPDPDEPPRDWWLGKNGPGRIKQAAHTGLETVDTDGFTEFHPIPGVKHAAPDPRRTPAMPLRPTNDLSPHSYVFTRPFDQRFAHHLTGQHFSMADHRRNYPILGMRPLRSRRNTYRIDPAPWDTNIVDYEPVEPPVSGRIEAVDIHGTVGPSYRLP